MVTDDPFAQMQLLVRQFRDRDARAKATIERLRADIQALAKTNKQLMSELAIVNAQLARLTTGRSGTQR